MNSLTTHYRRSQLIALPVPGGKAKVEYCYAVNVPGDREIVTHSEPPRESWRLNFLRKR